MTDASLAFEPITALAARIRSGRLSPVALTEALLDRVATLDKRLHSFILVTPDRALAQARAAEQALRGGLDLGPLHGIPYGAKDLYDVKGLPTTAGTRLRAQHVAREDCAVVQKLGAAGMACLGKAYTVQFAFGGVGINHDQGTPHNPWSSTPHAPGGSSSGSGVAVAAGLVPMALGSDTGGSIRIPAALCGIVGLKTTVGRISRAGVYPLSWSLDSVGPLTRTVEDAALVYQALQGEDPRDETTLGVRPHDVLPSLKAGVKGLRLAFGETLFFDDVDPEIAAAVRATGDVFGRLGAHVGTVATPEVAEMWTDKGRALLIAAEACAVNAEFLDKHFDALDPVVAHRMIGGRELRAPDYFASFRRIAALRARIQATLRDVDALLVPTTTIPPRPIAEIDASRESYMDANMRYLRNTTLGNMLNLCAVSVPCGLGRLLDTPGGVQHGVEAGQAGRREVGDDAGQAEDRDQLGGHRPEVGDGRRPRRAGPRGARCRRDWRHAGWRDRGRRTGGAMATEGAHHHLRGEEALALLTGAAVGIGHRPHTLARRVHRREITPPPAGIDATAGGGRVPPRPLPEGECVDEPIARRGPGTAPRRGRSHPALRSPPPPPLGQRRQASHGGRGLPRDRSPGARHAGHPGRLGLPATDDGRDRGAALGDRAAHRRPITLDEKLALVSAPNRVDPADRTKVVTLDTLQVVDLEASPPAVIARVALGSHPLGLSINRAGDLALVAHVTDGTISVLTIQGKTVTPVAKVKVGDDRSRVSHVAISPDGKWALAGKRGENTVAILSIDGTRVTYTGRDITVGSNPYAIDIAPDGRLAVVAHVGRATGDADTDTISLVDMTARPIPAVERLTVGPSPEGMAVSPDGRWLAAGIANGTNRPKDSPFRGEQGKLILFALQGATATRVAEVPTGKNTQGVAFTHNSRHLLVQNYVEGELAVYRMTGSGSRTPAFA